MLKPPTTNLACSSYSTYQTQSSSGGRGIARTCYSYCISTFIVIIIVIYNYVFQSIRIMCGRN